MMQLEGSKGRPLCRFLCLAGFLGGLAFAQFNSSIEGTVADATAASVPGAQVVLINEDTQVTQRVETSASGLFRITGLPPGSYRLEISHGGFKTWVQTQLVLQGSEARTVYPVLAVGEGAARIEVTATLNAIETNASKVSRSVETTTIAEVPMVGRNAYAAIVPLAPGITGSGQLFGSGAANATDSFQPEPGYQINAGGQRQEANEYQVDGTSVNGNSRDGIANLTPEPDTVSEVRVSANAFTAEKGRNSGALIEVFTKSGTNQFHGTLSEFHTDNDLTSRTVFQTSLPASRRNEYGFTFGGPAIKNKTFFFGSFYNLNASTATTSVVREETQQFAQYVESTFPNSLAAKFLSLDPPKIYPTTSISTVAQVQQSNPGSFPNTVIPLTLPAIGTATITQTLPSPSKQWNTRVDQNFHGYNDRIYADWYGTYSNPLVISTRPNLTYPYPTTNQFGRLSWTHTFAPALLNDASFSVVRAGGWYPPAPGQAANLPNDNITGISTGFSQAGYYRFQHNNYIMHDGLTWIYRSHTLKFGADIDRQQGYAVQSNLARPTFQFSNLLDFGQDLPFSQSGPTINIAAGDTAINLYRKLYAFYTGAYAQDDWKVSRRLTVNLGLRWDYFGHWATGAQGVIPFPIFTPGQGATFQQQIANGIMVVRGNGKGYFADNTPNGWAPRVGLAWDVFGDGSTSIRAGWGMFYSRVADLSFGTNGANTNPPAFGSPSVNIQQAGTVFGYTLGSSGGYYFPPPPGFSFKINSSGGIVGTRVSVGGVTPDPKQPTTQNYTFSIQRRLPGSFVLEADYLGSSSVHLYTQTDINRYAGNLITAGSLTRLNPNFGSIIYGQTVGNSRANIFSFALSKRFAKGWSANAVFTTGRALDADSSNDNGVANGRNIEDIWNINGQWGRADYDINKRFVLDSVYEIPSPFHSAIPRAILGGWRISGIAIFQSGLPFTVYTSAAYPAGDYNADGYNYDQPNAPAFGGYLSVSRSAFINGLFTASQFPKPAPGQEGNLGRNTYDGPGLANVNLNTIKTWHIPWVLGKEGATLEFRAELFNVLNRVNLNQPTSDLSSGLFGKSTSQKQARQAQFGIRIAF
jgi:Carboxypeptidase regulatory-like domain